MGSALPKRPTKPTLQRVSWVGMETSRTQTPMLTQRQKQAR